MRLALVLFLCALPAIAHAQGETVPLANGWSMTSRLRRMSDVNAVACADDRAYARSWGGGVVAWDGSAWRELPEVPGTMEGRVYGTHLAATPTGVAIEASGRLAIWDGTSWSIAERPNTSH